MRVNQFVTNINTGQIETMVAFYRDVVGLTPDPDDEPGAFMVGSASFVALIIESHDAVARHPSTSSSTTSSPSTRG